MFETVEQIGQALAGQRYIATDEIATVLFLAEKLGKPLLAEGPAGVGKTELSKAWAAATQRELVRLSAGRVDESAFMSGNMPQMLYTQLRDKL
jgi:MoxR-like ATPase